MFCCLSRERAPDYIHFRGLSGGPAGKREREREWVDGREKGSLCPADPIFQGTSLKSPVPYVECAYTPFRVYITVVRFSARLRYGGATLTNVPPLSSRATPVSHSSAFFRLRLFFLIFRGLDTHTLWTRFGIPDWLTRSLREASLPVRNTRRNLVARESRFSRANRVRPWPEGKRVNAVRGWRKLCKGNYKRFT